MACKHSRAWENGWCNVACTYCTSTQEITCEHNKQTNADRIRAMSDERLMHLIMGITIEGSRPWCNFHCEKDGEYGCCKCIMKWLQQPAEEE